MRSGRARTAGIEAPNVDWNDLIKPEKVPFGRIFRVVVMVSLKPIERTVRYRIRLEFLERQEGKGGTRRFSML